MLDFIPTLTALIDAECLVGRSHHPQKEWTCFAHEQDRHTKTRHRLFLDYRHVFSNQPLDRCYPLLERILEKRVGKNLGQEPFNA